MDISVLIPTFNKRETLRRVLLLYNQQQGVSGRFEVTVVDDGSSDGTFAMLEQLKDELKYRFRFLALPHNAGQAAARNRAIREAEGRVLFITGDDILPDERLLLEHWTWHNERHPQRHVGVLGCVRWADELNPTPFMRWLEEGGPQFAYGAIGHGDAVGHGYLYTCNISLKREFLAEAREQFDERLRLCEDSEWGLRLSRKGFEMRYNANALGKHLHVTTLGSSLKRMEALGAAAVVLRGVNHEEFSRITSAYFEPRNRIKLFLLNLALHPLLSRLIYVPLARLCERRIVADRVFAVCHASHFLKGLRAAVAPRTPTV